MESTNSKNLDPFFNQINYVKSLIQMLNLLISEFESFSESVILYGNRDAALEPNLVKKWSQSNEDLALALQYLSALGDGDYRAAEHVKIQQNEMNKCRVTWDRLRTCHEQKLANQQQAMDIFEPRPPENALELEQLVLRLPGACDVLQNEKQRSKKLEHLNRQLTGIASLAERLDSMVQPQGAQIDAVETRANQTNEATIGATTELGGAVDHARKGRRHKKIVGCGIFCSVLLVAGILAAVITIQRQQKATK